MSNPSDDRKNVAKRNAQSHFTATDQRDAQAREERGKLKAKTDAKIAKLRALRLAKEQAEKELSDATASAGKGKTQQPRTAPKGKIQK